jgi:exosortase sorting signal-containing protein
MQSFFRLSFALVAVCGLSWAAPAAAQVAQDVITVGTVAANGPAVVVPVYVRDVAGTPIGIDQPFGSRIQAFSIKVDYPPSAFIQSVTFTRAGITAPLTPTFETSPAVSGSISLLMTFDETTNLVPFVSNAAAPGNQVGQLTFTFAPGTPPGTVVPLTLDATLTQLSNEAGTTTETVANTNLALVPGSVTLLATIPVPTLSVWGLILLAAAICFVAIRARI